MFGFVRAWLERKGRDSSAGQSELAEQMMPPCNVCRSPQHAARRCRVCGEVYCGDGQTKTVKTTVFAKPWLVHVHKPCAKAFAEMARSQAGHFNKISVLQDGKMQTVRASSLEYIVLQDAIKGLMIESTNPGQKE